MSATFPKQVVEAAMLDAWNIICSDTGNHPLDIERTVRGGNLMFAPRHWSKLTADLLADRLSYLMDAISAPSAEKPTNLAMPGDGNRWGYDEIIEIMARGAWPQVFSERFSFPADREKARAQSLDEMRAALRALCLNGLTVVPSTSSLEYPHVERKSDNEFGWLIETGDHKYWDGRKANDGGFTDDPNDAVRFARFEDSERVIHWLMRAWSVFLVSRQHSWTGGVKQHD